MEDGIITKGELMGKIERMRWKMGRFVSISSQFVRSEGV